MVLPLIAFKTAHLEKLGLYLAIGLVAFLAAVFLTPLARKLALRLGMIDQPDPRRVNTRPIPRGGGLAVIFAFHTAALAALFLLPEPIAPNPNAYFPFLLASIGIALLGFIDDYRGLTPIHKLLGQIAIAIWLCLNGQIIHLHNLIPLPETTLLPLEYALTLFWIVGAINAFNLIDGLDGLATGLASIAAFGMGGALLYANRATDALPYLILLASCLGFMPYNFHPATIFLGDTGSMFLGLALASIPLTLPTITGEAFLTTFAPILAIGVPVIDVVLAIVRRTLRKLLLKFQPAPAPQTSQGGVMQPDRKHLHHRILDFARGHQRQAVILIYAIAFAGIILDLLICFHQSMAQSIFLVGFLALCWLLVRQMATVEFWDAWNLIREHRPRRRKRVLKTILYVGIDIACCFLSYAGAFALIGLSLTRQNLLATPFYFAPTLILLYFTGVYRKVWSRTRHLDFVQLALTILCGCALTSLMRQLCLPEPQVPIALDAIFSAFLIVSTLFYRSLFPSFVEFANHCEHLVLRRKPDAVHALVLGGGSGFLLFFQRNVKQTGDNRICVDGILDDDRSLLGTTVSGVPVWGLTDDLTAVLDCHPEIRMLVLTAELEPVQRNTILETAAQRGLDAREFLTILVPAAKR